MSFPLGQVWFLHTLFFIILASPLFFILRERSNNNYLLIIMCGIIVFSGVQLFFGIDHYFHSLVGNLYKPIIHSSFFIFGIISFTSDRFRSVKISTMLLIVCLTLSSFLVYIIDLNVDLAFHTYAPDLYYVLVSYSAIFAVLLAKPIIVYLVEFNVIIRHVFMFFHKHTFSIFLMHSFAIFLVEKIGGLVDPPDKTIEYGILKLSIVLIVTCFIAVPFTAISGAIVKKLIYIFTLKKV